jgi:hypothetical protein
MGTNFLSGESSVWTQPLGPNTEPKYLGCHSVGDIPEPKGDTTKLWCPDPAKTGAFVAKNSFRGEPGAITTSITTDLRKTADYLEDLAAKGCPFPLFIHKVSCGRRDVFTNYDRSFVLRQVNVTSSSLTKLASKDPADNGESGQTFDVSAEEVLRVFNMELSRVSLAETEDITGIAIAGEDRCEGSCGASQKSEDDLFISSKALVGSVSNTADVLRSLRGGVWTATSADPLTGGKDIQGVASFAMGRDITRILVTNGTTQAAHPAEVSYTDNNGTTWTTAHVGSINAEYITSMFALDRYHVWVGTDGGRIYFSSDAGVNWTLQENAVLSATDVVGISASDDLNLMAIYTGGEVAISSDGGSTWSAVTDSGLTNAFGIHMLSSYNAWAVGTQGLFFTTDSGITWTLRNSYAIGAIDFLNEMFGIAVGSAVNGLVYVTIDGGFDWQALPAVANGGFTFVKILSTKLAYVGGKISGGTGFLAKVTPVS